MKASTHWLAQRMSAIALIPLSIWFVLAITKLDGSYEAVHTWIAQPINAALLCLYIPTIFYHAFLGIEVILDDYVHGVSAKIFSLKFSKFACGLATVVAFWAVIKVAIA